MSIFDQWDSEIDVAGLQKDIAESASNDSGAKREEVPHGEYEVSVRQMELKASKKGDPMVSIWFQVVSGDYKNSIIFFNQVITQGFQIHIVNNLLRAMTAETGASDSVEFVNYKQYGQLIMDVHEAIDDNYEFLLDYKAAKNPNFSTYTIKEVFVLE